MKNYIRSAFGLTVMVCLMVFGLRYIPDDIVANASIKPIDIIADLNRDNTVDELDQLDAEAGADTEQVETPSSNDTPVAENMKGDDYLQLIIDTYKEDKSATSNADTLVVAEPKKDSIPRVDTISIATVDSLPAEPIQVYKEGVIPILDYSAEGAMLRIFTTRLKNIKAMTRPVRVGFMGDSFIEGDIMTNEFREMMQTKYGGGGVGFVPITSQVAGFRQTVRHEFDGWRQNTILRNRDGVFTISAFNYTPEENSTVEYKGSKNKKHLSSFKQARMLFISHGRSVIRATVNGSQEYIFNTEPGEELQEFMLEADEYIETVKYTVSDVDGLTVYGVFLDDNRGVCVDNFGVRSSSGTLMARVNLGLTRQFRQLAPYDLIVLQYGLNVASDGVVKYSSYQKQMTTVVNHMKRCFPNAAIMVVSVGDRAKNASGKTMKGITAMVQTQKQVAQNCGVLFWSLYDAMIAEGGIAKFVKNGWAAKDYTHLSSRGGKKIATSLYEAVTAAKESN